MKSKWVMLAVGVEAGGAAVAEVISAEAVAWNALTPATPSLMTACPYFAPRDAFNPSLSITVQFLLQFIKFVQKPQIACSEAQQP